MTWKRTLADAVVWLMSTVRPARREVPEDPKAIFVLRNNDLGDLLVTTPLFEALRKRFPRAEIVAGIGQWNLEILKNNPFVSRTMVVNAPWHNKFVAGQSYYSGFKYALFSADIVPLKQCHFDIGIDVLGSYYGAILMMQAHIPFRLGVKGYGGGHSAAQRYYQFDRGIHVGRAGLKNAELLGLPAAELPENRPQIYLSQEEEQYAEEVWNTITARNPATPRLIISPGGGLLEKCWPSERFLALTQRLVDNTNWVIAITGGKQERELGQRLATLSCRVKNLAGITSLRQSFATTARADVVVCNASMQMHASAAFRKPCLVLLGDWEYFTSTRSHFLLWGYPEQVHIGKEATRPELCSVDEAFDALRTLGAKAPARAELVMK